MEKTRRDHIALITTFFVWVLPWVVGILLALRVQPLAPAAPPEDATLALTAAIEFIVMLLILIALVRAFGTKILAVGAMVTVGVGVLVFFNLVVGLHVILAFLFAISAVVASQQLKSLLVHNLVIILGLLGLGLFLGTTFEPHVFLGFLAILAVYDLLAFATGFLPSVVRHMQERGVPMFVLIQIPDTFREWLATTKRTHVRVVGTGDIFAPLLLFVSLSVSGQPLTAWACAVGAAVGVLLDLYIIQHVKPRAGIPALPTIVVGIFIAYGLCQLFP